MTLAELNNKITALKTAESLRANALKQQRPLPPNPNSNPKLRDMPSAAKKKQATAHKVREEAAEKVKRYIDETLFPGVEDQDANKRKGIIKGIIKSDNRANIDTKEGKEFIAQIHAYAKGKDETCNSNPATLKTHLRTTILHALDLGGKKIDNHVLNSILWEESVRLFKALKPAYANSSLLGTAFSVIDAYFAQSVINQYEITTENIQNHTLTNVPKKQTQAKGNLTNATSTSPNSPYSAIGAEDAINKSNLSSGGKAAGVSKGKNKSTKDTEKRKAAAKGRR